MQQKGFQPAPIRQGCKDAHNSKVSCPDHLRPQVSAELVRVQGRPSVEALKATVDREWQHLKEIRRSIIPAVITPSVRLYSR